jgi:glycosyltransferase involved in cell wall biosynthesis
MTEVAVVVPVYNRRSKLLRTLATVVAQSKQPALLIVVDDGSSDGTGQFAESWLARNASFEWKVIRQANAGAAAARNAGFAAIGSSPFVCFLDSDDLWPPEFLAEGLRAIEGRDDAVAAIADRVQQVAGRRQPVENLRQLVPNPILWIVCNDGGILSCALIRSTAVRAAGLFVPGMIASEDSDFFIRLFQLGAAVRSDATPVRQIKKARLEPTEAPNLSDALPDLPYLWARHLDAALSTLPKSLFTEHRTLMRTAVARRWAYSAFSSRRTHQIGRAIISLFYAVWRDYKWRRRGQLIWSFCRGNNRVLAYYKIKLWRSHKENRKKRIWP